jgi:predicted O-linked N-acetylglucosamine transferase (SPINDLY family)
VNWLGYPGTLGHKRLADYIIGDAIVTPPEDAKYYSERLALMPDSYQPNDRLRPLPELPSRAEAGLPEKGLVFCSFNQAIKFNSQTFAIWARLLTAVPDSILWLLQPKSPIAGPNIRQEMVARGVSGERVIFAPVASQADHIARLRLSDLALDTFPCTSHTTGSDALWAGVPLITMKGQTFASRVAASLLTVHGFSDLITETEDDYFNLALELATNAQRRTTVKERLERARMTSPLFDAVRFTRNLENLYCAIVDNHNTSAELRSPVVTIA